MRNSAISFLYDTVKKLPNKLCISDENETLNFSQIFSRAFFLAEVLKQKEIIHQPILVYLPKNISSVLAFAAILLSGNFYVPLEIKSPIKRQHNIIRQFDEPKIISSKEYTKNLQKLGVEQSQTIYIEDIALSPTYSIDEMIAISLMKTDNIINTDPCYIMYTSGSTGTPKGVVISHRGVIDYIEWAISCLKVDENEIIGNQSPLHFDNSTLDIYLSWATGASLHLIPEEMFLFPVQLIEYLDKHKITFIFFIPSVLANISRLKLLSSNRPPALNKIIFAGEVMPTKHLAYWQKNLPGRLFVNLYGPTEITVDCMYFIVNRVYQPQESLPIGFPRHNMSILILDENCREVQAGEKGELCVRGSSLSLGYWKDYEKTKQAFIQNPLRKNYTDIIYRTGDICYQNDRGEIIFVGRKDSQIKHMGYRIELGEIEVASRTMPEIDNCCALYNIKTQEITLFYEGDREMPVDQFRISLSQYLPNYMVPKKFTYMESLPINPNGKIDRLALKEIYL